MRVQTGAPMRPRRREASASGGPFSARFVKRPLLLLSVAGLAGLASIGERYFATEPESSTDPKL